MVITILLRSRLHQLENALQVNLHDSASGIYFFTEVKFSEEFLFYFEWH